MSEHGPFWPHPVRGASDWEPFMEGLVHRVRGERRRRALIRLAAAAALVLTMSAPLQMRFAGRTELLSASVPTGDQPVFRVTVNEDAPAAFFVVRVEEESI